MVTSAELEQLITKHRNQINKEHIDLFLSIINDLSICSSSKISNPFLCINNVIHLYYCEKIHFLTFTDIKHFMKNMC